MTWHTSRSRFTFYTHILSAGQQLSVRLLAVQLQYALVSIVLVIVTSVMFITRQELQYYRCHVFFGLP